MDAVRNSRNLLPLLTLVTALAAVGCNDTTGLNNWDATPDTVTLYSASRAELSGLQSGFDFTSPRAVIVESVSTAEGFDFVVTDQGGSFLLMPSGALLAQSNRAGLAKVPATDLTSIRQAPSDTAAFEQKVAVPVQPGDFLVVRSRRVSCLLSTASYYAKMQVLAVDPVGGTLRFAYARNPFCSNQSLVPPGS